jgi:hypothetical protein
MKKIFGSLKAIKSGMEQIELYKRNMNASTTTTTPEPLSSTTLFDQNIISFTEDNLFGSNSSDVSPGFPT